ncbi:toxin [Candidatus Gracilibacteria bacterium]|nr:MAG: toxin [Candidatus Gracilibacteria bacterium]
MNIKWNEEKNIKLILDDTRGNIGFEDIKEKILNDEIIVILPNDNYDNQEIYVFDFYGYPVACPFVKNKEEIFLKTLYKCRKYKKYLKNHI